MLNVKMSKCHNWLVGEAWVVCILPMHVTLIISWCSGCREGWSRTLRLEDPAILLDPDGISWGDHQAKEEFELAAREAKNVSRWGRRCKLDPGLKATLLSSKFDILKMITVLST